LVPSQSFAAAINVDGAAPVVSVMGEVDRATAPALERTLADVAEERSGELIVDLTACRFLDTQGLNVLLNTKRRLEQTNRRLTLVLSNPNLMRIFQITKSDDLFEIHPSVTAAMNASLSTVEQGIVEKYERARVRKSSN
jgi:anti-sigma B factor antagonist